MVLGQFRALSCKLATLLLCLSANHFALGQWIGKQTGCYADSIATNPADIFHVKIWGLSSLRQYDRPNLDHSSSLLPFHLRTRLLAGKFVENLGNGLIFEIQNIYLLADDQVIL